jgi:hypothetical protein
VTAQKQVEWTRRLGKLRVGTQTKQAAELEYAHGFVTVCEKEQADPYDLLTLANTLELKL